MSESERTKEEWWDLKTVKTPRARLSFPHLFTAHKGKNAKEGEKAKFKATFLIPKDTDISELRAAAWAAAEETWGPNVKSKEWRKKKGFKLRLPFRDGDTKENLEGYAGHYFIEATALKKPGVVDKARQPIEDEGEIYGGCYVRAQLCAFTYDNSGNKGVSFGLRHVQKLADGEAFSGRKSAEQVFDDEFDAGDDDAGDDEMFS